MCLSWPPAVLYVGERRGLLFARWVLPGNEGQRGADARDLKAGPTEILLRHLVEHLPWPLVSRQVWRNEWLGPMAEEKGVERERRREGEGEREMHKKVERGQRERHNE